ncbi:hypothetical protein GF420_02060, partial [candidate division GN15 bacterium]|nr:hypothetical protein [candidate division GN15 bacterium]
MPRWIRVVILTVLVIVFLFTSAYVYLFPMNGLERVVSSQLNREIRERYNLSADFADMRGNPFTGIMIEDIRVIYTDSLGAYEILHVPRLTTAYQLSNLWHRDYRFELVDITSPKVTIRRDSTGAWRLPDLTSDAAETTRPPSFLVSNLIVSEADMLVIAPGRDTMQLDDMTVAASVRVEEGMVSADLKQMEFVSPSADVELTAATGKVALSDNRLVVQDLAIASRQTRARLNGAVTLDDLTGRIDFALDQVDLAEVTRWVGPNLRGVVDLTGSATLQGDSLDGSVNIAGDFMFASFENLQVDFRWYENQLMLDTLYGVILDNCSIDGAGWI